MEYVVKESTSTFHPDFKQESWRWAHRNRLYIAGMYIDVGNALARMGVGTCVGIAGLYIEGTLRVYRDELHIMMSLYIEMGVGIAG